CWPMHWAQSERPWSVPRRPLSVPAATARSTCRDYPNKTAARNTAAGSSEGDRAAAAWISATAELAAVRIQPDGLRPAEVEVLPLPAHDRDPAALEVVKAPLVHARLRLHGPGLEVEASGDHRLLGVHLLLQDPHARLQDRGADPIRSRTSQPQHDLAVAKRQGRGHHRADAAARRDPVKALWVQVLLAQHVVDVHPRPGYHDSGARPIRAGDRGAVAVGIDDGQVRRGAES